MKTLLAEIGDGDCSELHLARWLFLTMITKHLRLSGALRDNSRIGVLILAAERKLINEEKVLPWTFSVVWEMMAGHL